MKRSNPLLQAAKATCSVEPPLGKAPNLLAPLGYLVVVGAAILVACLTAGVLV